MLYRNIFVKRDFQIITINFIITTYQSAYVAMCIAAQKIIKRTIFISHSRFFKTLIDI